MFEGLRTSMDVVTIVITLLAFGCPVQAIVQAYGLDERTVASWRDRAGKQCQRVHTEVVRQMSHGSFEQAMLLLQRSGGGQVLNTSYIERLNGTVRERLASLTRKCRHAAQRLEALETGMYLIGST